MDFGLVCLGQILLYGEAAVLACTPLAVSRDKAVLPALVAFVILFLSIAMALVSWGAFVFAWGRQLGGWRLGERLQRFSRLARCSQRIRGCPSRLGWLSQSGFWVALVDLSTFALLTLTLVYFAWQISAAWYPLDLASRVDAVIRFERLVHLSNGMTPVLTRVFFCGALFGWGYCLVKKLFLANRCRVICPFPDNGSQSFTGIHNMDARIRWELMPPSTLSHHFWECFGLSAFVGVVLVKFWHDTLPPVDGWWFGRIALVGFSFGSLLVLFTLLQLYFAWRSVKKMLRFLALLPMQNAFQRLSDKVVSIFGRYLFSLRPRHSHLIVSVQQFHRLQQLFPAFLAALEDAVAHNEPIGGLAPAGVAAAWVEVKAVFRNGRLEPVVSSHFEHEVQPDEDDLEPPPSPQETAPLDAPQDYGGQTGKDVHLLASHCLRVLRHFWPAHTMGEAFGRPTQDEQQTPASTYLSLKEGNPIREWVVVAEEFAPRRLPDTSASSSFSCEPCSRR